jgi:lipopolysaccharide export system protein LptA
MSARSNRKWTHIAASVSALLPLVLLSFAASALESDREKPMNIDAGHLDSGLNEGLSLLTGGVRIDQGSLQVRADRAEVHQNDKHEVQRAVLDGQPATLKQALDEGGQLDARALHIDYDLGKNLVVLTGNVVVNQPKGELRGERVTYDLNTAKFTGGSESGEGRVFLKIQPQQKAASDKPKAAAPAATTPPATPEKSG